MESGRCSSKVEVRLLRFWEYRYVRRGGETNHITVDMFLIDWKGTLMPATVNASSVPTFRPHLTAGAIYSIAGFDVALLDVSVTLSMFDSNTVSFHKRLEAMRGDPRKWLEVLGRLYLNATSGAHIYFDKETNVGESYFYKLVSTDTGLPSAAPLLRGYAKVETLTISERNEFIITALTQDIDFICTGKVTSSKIEKRMMFCCLLRLYQKKLQRAVVDMEGKTWKEKHSPFREATTTMDLQVMTQSLLRLKLVEVVSSQHQIREQPRLVMSRRPLPRMHL
uniref:Uncharacterized protein n=1 Tax=Brassica oleracea TaxID=3712 RepID=A0A3P6BGG8_BRAOL|nr:unnamed protein product [Brassica oleracea]